MEQTETTTMMETVAAVIPHDVYSYVHACDGRVDLSLEASIDGDVSPDLQLEAAAFQQYCAGKEALVASLANGAADPNPPAEHSLEYQDPNAGGDLALNPETEAFESFVEGDVQNPTESGDAAFPQEGVVYYMEDSRPYVWNAAEQAFYFVNPDPVPDQQTADEVPVDAAEAEAASQYTEVPANAEAAVIYADSAQVQGDGEGFVPTETAEAQAYYGEDGTLHYEATPGLEVEYEAYVEQQPEASHDYVADGNTPCQGDPAQYVEQYSAGETTYSENYGEVTATAADQVEAYAEQDYSYASPEAESAETQFVSETQESQVPETVPVEAAFTPEERQRDLDAAFFGAKEAKQVAQQVSEPTAIVTAEEQVFYQEYQDPAQTYADPMYQETPVDGQVVYSDDPAAYVHQDGTEGYAYDPAAYVPEAQSQELPADHSTPVVHEGQVAPGYEGEAHPGYESGEPSSYEVEVPQDHGGEVLTSYESEAQQAFEEEAVQGEYQQQVDGQYYEQSELTENAAENYEYTEAYGDAEGNPNGYAPDGAYDDAAVAYGDAVTEAYPPGGANDYYENTDVETSQTAEMTQEQVVWTQKEYDQYYQQHGAVGVQVVADPSHQVCYTEQAEQQLTAEAALVYDTGVEQADGTAVHDPAYGMEAVEADQYTVQETFETVSSVADGIQAAQVYKTVQEFIAEDGTAAPEAENVSETVFHEEQYAQSDQGYLSERANDSTECLIEAAADEQSLVSGEVYAETGEYCPQQNAEEYYAPEGQYAQENVEQYVENAEQYPECYEEQCVQEYTEEELREYAAQLAAAGSVEQYSEENSEQYPQQFAEQGAYSEQTVQDYEQQQPTEYAEQDPQGYETHAYTEYDNHPQHNGEEIPAIPSPSDPAEGEKSDVSPNIVRGKPFTREMDSTEKFKSFQIEYERTPAFDALGHCLKFLGVRRGFVCSIRADGVVCVQLKGSQQDEWQDTEFEYDASTPAAKVEIGKLYIIAHSFDGNKYMERCRVKDIDEESADIHLIDTGCERTIPKNQLYDIINLEEVERLPPQVVEIFVVGLTYEGYSKEDLEQLEKEWNPYEEVFIIPVDAPKGGLIRTIVSRKTGETLGIRAPPQNANKAV